LKVTKVIFNKILSNAYSESMSMLKRVYTHFRQRWDQTPILKNTKIHIFYNIQ